MGAGPAWQPLGGPPAAYRGDVEILLWLVPPVLVTVAAMCWVGWVGRDPRAVDREVMVRRLARGMARETPLRYAAPRPERDRSTGIAVRPSRARKAS
ncbi:hypothetical protein I601_0049 [Nocardioides dokdonensis FR1436]|uniref:Uncharacterized protein n=1 Tax=Nocardioides dokdonensis FR1436 TaxID=1300347 RepID=A0A1A9GE49_9ACTN|nr:hypothetical protein I601_0049 [Nocardioides dokdonensis FR1436]